MVRHYKIVVRGKVQGVFYRASTKKEATKLGIKGSVKNQSDGSVFIEAEGTSDQLDALLNWCHRGPELAQVISVDFVTGELEHYQSFEVTR